MNVRSRHWIWVCLLTVIASAQTPPATPGSAALASYVSQRVAAIQAQLDAGTITTAAAGIELDDQITIIQAGQFAFGADFTGLGTTGATLSAALTSAQQLIVAARASLGAPGSSTLIDQRLISAKGALDVVSAGITAGNTSSLTAAQQATLSSLTIGSTAAVSAASFAGPVASGSIATLFAAKLAAASTAGNLDSKGNLPTSLGGVAVDIGGQRAGLLFAGTTQASIIVPTGLSTGPNDVLVTTDGGSVYKGTVNVSTVAPGVFSFAQNGAGEGVIVNGVTNARGPFAVTTATNPGSDKRTRLTMYVTGLRNATGLLPTATQASSVQVTIGGLPVVTEFAGPHPTFQGLDQVNVVVPATLANAGVLNVQIQVSGAASNTVTAAFAETGALIFHLRPMTARGKASATFAYTANPTGLPGEAQFEAAGLPADTQFAIYSGKDAASAIGARNALATFRSDATGKVSMRFAVSDPVGIGSTLVLRTPGEAGAGETPLLITTGEFYSKEKAQ